MSKYTFYPTAILSLPKDRFGEQRSFKSTVYCHAPVVLAFVHFALMQNEPKDQDLCLHADPQFSL